MTKIEEQIGQTKVKSVVVGVWKGQNEVLTLALGESMSMVPSTKDMHIRIGGVTETFQGTLLMMLVEQGHLKLDDKISKWLPDLLSADEVTVEMLIKNTAGYKDYVLNDAFVNLITNQPFREITREEIIEYSVGDGKMNFPPGTKQAYSHTEFTILGEVMERATEKTMKQLYEENIFKPMGLKNTGYISTPELPLPVMHVFSKDRGVYEDATYWNPSWTGESGSLYSNLADLGRWGYIFGKGQLISPESFENLVGRYENYGREDLYFASGFVVANGWYLQNPSFNGYSGAFGFQPDGDYTVVVYSSISEDSPEGTVAFNIYKELIKIVTPDKPVNF